MRTCTQCSRRKPDDQFNWKITGKQRQPKCKKCQSAYQKRWYKNCRNCKTRAATNRKASIQQHRQFLVCYLSTHPCIDCGNTDIRVLEFDHLRDKTDTLASLIRRSGSIEHIKTEIEKCDVVCSNCHHIRTYDRMKQKGNRVARVDLVPCGTSYAYIGS